jgi:hypothetical protein
MAERDAHLYIGGEGRPGSTVTREGRLGSNSYRACPRAGSWSGSCPCRVRVLGFQLNMGTGAGSCQARARGRPCCFIRGSCLNGTCPCRPNWLIPFGHLYEGLCSGALATRPSGRPWSSVLTPTATITDRRATRRSLYTRRP